MSTVMIWACIGLLSMLTVGFMFCVALMLYGMWYQRKDREMVMLYGIMSLVSAVVCTGLIFAVIALGRNL